VGFNAVECKKRAIKAAPDSFSGAALL